MELCEISVRQFEMFGFRRVTPTVAQCQILAACWRGNYVVAFHINHTNAKEIQVVPYGGSAGSTVIRSAVA